MAMSGKWLICTACCIWWACTGVCWASFSILDYNVHDIEPAADVELQALQRILNFFDPDIVTFQEAKGQSDITNFLNANPAYQGYRSTTDGAGNRQLIMSKLEIVNTSVCEHELGGFRPLLAATIDLPGPQDLEVLTAHWSSSEPENRVLESANSVQIISNFNQTNPDAFYVYTGDFNETSMLPGGKRNCCCSMVIRYSMRRGSCPLIISKM